MGLVMSYGVRIKTTEIEQSINLKAEYGRILSPFFPNISPLNRGTMSQYIRSISAVLGHLLESQKFDNKYAKADF